MKAYEKAGLLVVLLRECIKRKMSIKVAQRFLKLKFNIIVDKSVLNRQKEDIENSLPA